MLRLVFLGLTICLIAAAVGSAGAADDHGSKKTYTDPKNADEDFAFQGEYSGVIDTGDGEEQGFGLQVVALGEGKFKAVAYFGGLPGDGWDEFTKLDASGELKDGQVVITADEGTATLKDGKAVIRDLGQEELGVLKKVNRTSPTLGAEPPEGAIVLFDGTSLDAFEGGRLTDEGYLMPTVPAGIVTKKKFNDFKLHIEFRTPYMPAARGQGRGNSGVYLQDRYEVQVLDSFGLEGLDNECGGFYSIKTPSVNMCFPPLSWQTYDVDFTAAKYNDDGEKTENAKVTVRHNGVVIHQDVELPSDTPGRKKEGPEPAGIHMQWHGNPVVYKNIWVTEG